MNTKLLRLFSSCAMAAVLTCTGVAAQAAEIVGTECADTLSIESCAANVKRIYKANYPDQAEMIDRIVDSLCCDEEFTVFFENEGATAFRIAEDTLRDALETEVTPYYLSGGVYRSKYTVPAIKQQEDYYCGPASVLQALVGNGVWSDIYSGTSAIRQAASKEKQDEIAAAMNTDSTGTYMYQISAYMRSKFPEKNGFQYKAKYFSSDTYKKAIGLVKASLEQNGVPIIRIPDTSVLGYYNGLSQRHYVCISEVNTNAGTVTLVDPNHSRVDLCDRHVISMTEFENLVNTDGWIAVYTSAANGYDVYE